MTTNFPITSVNDSIYVYAGGTPSPLPCPPLQVPFATILYAAYPSSYTFVDAGATLGWTYY